MRGSISSAYHGNSHAWADVQTMASNWLNEAVQRRLVALYSRIDHVTHTVFHHTAQVT